MFDQYMVLLVYMLHTVKSTFTFLRVKDGVELQITMPPGYYKKFQGRPIKLEICKGRRKLH